ncbi:PepSY-associated TM helix domain-containing protein [Porticoccus sp.]
MVLLHKYLGLVLGLLLTVIGASGSLLVFDHELDEAMTPILSSEHGESASSLQAVLDAAVVAGGEAVPYRLLLGRKPGRPHVVQFVQTPGSPGPLEVAVTPSGGEVVSVRTWGKYPMSWIYRLHMRLLSGAPGHYLVGFLGLGLLFFCVSGLILWWPRKGRWNRAFGIKVGSGAFRFNFDLHRTVGIYLLPVLMLSAISGVALVFFEPLKQGVGRVLPMDEEVVPTSVHIPGRAPLTVDQAALVARKEFPEAELKQIFLPRKTSDSYRFSLRQAGEPWDNHGASLVWVDQYSGEVLGERNALAVPAGNSLLIWLFPLHSGDALGAIGRCLILLGGLAPGLLFATGLYLWLRKRLLLQRR